MAYEDCLEVCFVGLVVERICVWCLAIITIFIGFGQAAAKRCGGCLKVINWGWWYKSQKGSSFHREGRFSLCNTAALLQILLGIYCKIFYWRLLFIILLLLYVFQVGKAKKRNSKCPDETLNGLFQKHFQVFYFTPENLLSLTLPPSPCFFPL